MYLWWSLCTSYLHACQLVRVTVGDSGLCCCTCVTYFEHQLSPLGVVYVSKTNKFWRLRLKPGIKEPLLYCYSLSLNTQFVRLKCESCELVGFLRGWTGESDCCTLCRRNSSALSGSAKV